LILRLARILVRAVGTLVMVAVLNFILFRVVPGDPATLLLAGSRSGISQGQIQSVRDEWGLDRPLFPDQLVAYMESTLRGDLGYSFKYRGEKVTDLLVQRLPATIVLVGLAQVLAIAAGLYLGAIAGWRRGKGLDRVVTNTSLVLYATPYFWLGMVLVLIFSTGLGWLPPSGLFTTGVTAGDPVAWVVDGGSHLVLPVTAVGLGLLGQYVLVTRAAIGEVLTEDYMVTARAKGLREGQMLARHAFQNGMLPVITLVTLNLGYIVAGTITAEAVFGWPGVGALTVEALNARDYPVLQGIFLLLGASIVLANLLADIVYGFLDPRVRR
jgi:peptide/nickel transport system permease protein